MAAMGVFSSWVMDFDPEMIATIVTIYTAQDAFGTACNVTSDVPLCLLTNKIFERN
jgi:Na+/H+-dicarboxylate symporter